MIYSVSPCVVIQVLIRRDLWGNMFLLKWFIFNTYISRRSFPSWEHFINIILDTLQHVLPHSIKILLMYQTRGIYRSPDIYLWSIFRRIVLTALFLLKFYSVNMFHVTKCNWIQREYNPWMSVVYIFRHNFEYFYFKLWSNLSISSHSIPFLIYYLLWRRLTQE